MAGFKRKKHQAHNTATKSTSGPHEPSAALSDSEIDAAGSAVDDAVARTIPREVAQTADRPRPVRAVEADGADGADGADEASETSSTERSSDGGSESGDDAEEGGGKCRSRTGAVFRPGIDKMEDGEEMVYEASAYECLHRLQLDWPCLTFDWILDPWGYNRVDFPMRAQFLGGQQPAGLTQPTLCVCQVTNMQRTHDDDDDEDEEDEEAHTNSKTQNSVLDRRVFAHKGIAQRVKSCTEYPSLAVSLSSDGDVHVWDLGVALKSLENPTIVTDYKMPPVFSSGALESDAFAVSFCPGSVGTFVTGNTSGKLDLFIKASGSHWAHQTIAAPSDKPVEEVDFKKLGAGFGSIFATASSDQSIRVWDLRVASASAGAVLTMSNAHDGDINALSWNPIAENVILTASEDGSTAVWDIKMPGEKMAYLQYHKDRVASVSWHPTEDSIFASSSSDNSIAVWDLAVESADVMPAAGHDDSVADLPDQLMFLHQGQEDPNEVKFHPQIPGLLLSVALDSLHVWKPAP